MAGGTMNDLLKKLEKVGNKLGKMKAMEEQNHVLKLDNAYLQKKIARLERDNEDLERRIEELSISKEFETDFPLHYSRDYDMRLENFEADDQQSGASKSDSPAEDQPAANRSATGKPNGSAERSAKSTDDQQLDETEFKDDDDEFQLMTYGFMRKIYCLDPDPKSGETLTEKICSKPAAKEKAKEKTNEKIEEKTEESAAQGSASPVELPSSTVCRSSESDVCRLRNDLEKVIRERNEFKSKYEEYKAKYKKTKRKLGKKSSHKEIKEERDRSKRSGDDKYVRELKSDLKYANHQVKSLEDQLDKLKDQCHHMDRELVRKNDQDKLQLKEIAKFKEECKRLHCEMSQYERSEIVLRRDVKALSEKLSMKRGVRDCPNCLKLESKCHELNDMYKRTLELLVFETSK